MRVSHTKKGVSHNYSSVVYEKHYLCQVIYTMRNLLILLFFVFNGILELQAQNPFAVHLNRNNGMPANEIFGIFEDHRGFIWMTTSKGLCRFDGINFKSYNSHIKSTKQGNNIQENTDGSIWYCTFDGVLLHTQGDSLVVFNTPPILFSTYCVHDDNLIYCTTSYIISCHIPTTHINKQEAFQSIRYSSMLPLGDKLAIVTDDNILLYAADGTLLQTIPSRLGTNQSSRTAYSNGLFYNSPGFSFEVNQINEKGERTVLFKPNLPHRILQLSTIDRQLWVCTSKGVWCISLDDPNAETKVYFQEESIAKVLKSRDGAYWFTTTDNGLFIVPSFDNHILDIGTLKPNLIKTIKESVICSGMNGDFYEVSPNQVKLIHKATKESTLFDFEYSAIKPTAANMKTLETLLSEFSYQNGFIYSAIFGSKQLVELDDKYLAIGSSNGLMLTARINTVSSIWDKSFNTSIQNPYLANLSRKVIRVKSIAYNASSKTIYTATNEGLFAQSPEGQVEIKDDKDQPLLLRKLIMIGETLVALNSEGQLILKSNGAPIVVFKNNPQVGAIKIIKYCAPYLFLVHENIIEYSRIDDNTIHNGQLAFESLNLSLNADFITDIAYNKDYLYLSYDGNLISMAFAQTKATKPSPPFWISKASLGGIDITNAPAICVNALQNDLEISFSILDYLTPLTHSIAYSINGNNWEALNANERKLRLPALVHGDYTIQFRIDDVIVPQAVVFSISAPWYLQKWFLLCCVLSTGLGIYWFVKTRLAKLNEKNQLQLEKLQLENRLKQSMMSSIKSQMNPHFLFNALNTIQSFIVTEDKHNASSYLSKFSKLTRKILEMSEQEFVTLSEELEALHLYLGLEKIRFDNFVYTVTIDGSINPEILYIPSMIIQPYLENAIKHGLLHKKGERLLKVNIEKLDEQHIELTIDDNGVGRKTSQELNNIKNREHRSFATEANKKRLEILNQDNSSISIEYLDKVDMYQNALGTTVKIILPIRFSA